MLLRKGMAIGSILLLLVSIVPFIQGEPNDVTDEYTVQEDSYRYMTDWSVHLTNQSTGEVTRGPCYNNVESWDMEQNPLDGPMNSSWPMFHHDVRHTGRSPYGPIGNWPLIKWKFRMKGMVISSPAIDKNGTLYVGSNGENCLYAIYSNGTEKWRAATGNTHSSPAIASDGIIYIGTDSGNLCAIYPNGTIKWITHLGAGWVCSSPAIGTDGTIYTASVGSSRLCAVLSNGTIKWYFYATDWIYSSPAIDNNGIIYIGSHDHYLYAVYPNGTLKWKYQTSGEVKSPPSIGDDGTIYVCSWDHYLYAIAANGTLKWKFGTGGATDTSPAIALDGTVYIGSYDRKIYSIAPNGIKNWAYQTGDSVLSSPVVDKNGIIYFGSTDGNLYVLNPNGTLRWRFYTGNLIESSPVISEDGRIYIIAELLPPPDFYSYLYCIEIINNNPPAIPMITGTAHGKVRTTYDYIIVSSDSDDDNISYFIDWGDDSTTDWIGPYVSGEQVVQSHQWTKRGTYTIQVKARDEHGMESDWGTLTVIMPYEPPQHPFIHWLLERFPNAFPILRFFLEFNH